MTPSLVSIIIPIFNFGNYIEQCLNSIIRQNYDNIEIIIVNDGSTDSSPFIIDRFALSDKRIRVIHKKNEGVSAARNDGLKSAKGKYVVFVDGDDYLSTDAISYLVELIESNNADFALSKNCFTRNNESQIVSDRKTILSAPAATKLLLSPKIIVGCWNKIYNRDFLIRNNIFFNQTLFYGEGLHFITKVAQRTNNIIVGEYKCYYYRRNNYSSATSSFNINKFKNGLKSINLIEDEFLMKDRSTIRMLNWHKCQFYMGIVIRIKEARNPIGSKCLLDESLTALRKNSWKFVFNKDLPFYNKAILIGTSLVPSIFAFLDRLRRKNIARSSVK